MSAVVYMSNGPQERDANLLSVDDANRDLRSEKVNGTAAISSVYPFLNTTVCEPQSLNAFWENLDLKAKQIHNKVPTQYHLLRPQPTYAPDPLCRVHSLNEDVTLERT